VQVPLGEMVRKTPQSHSRGRRGGGIARARPPGQQGL